MDPLSVLASVIGLMHAASRVSSILATIAINISEKPQLMDDVLSEVNEVKVSLSAVHKFLLGMASAPRRRIALIQLDQLIATLTESVLTFAELEDQLAPFAAPELPLMGRAKWVWKEDTISRIVQRLQRHKSSLSLMLNIVQCESDLEAEQSRDKLQHLVEQLLESNQDMSRRLRTIEATSGSQGTYPRRLRNSTRIDRASIVQFSFEKDLEASRVYQRTRQYNSDVSFTSSAVRTHAWSMLSGLSLADVSAISAMALPLYPHEISNRQGYKFGESRRADTKRASPARNAPLTSSTAKRTAIANTGPTNKVTKTRAALPTETFGSKNCATVDKRIREEYKHVNEDAPAHGCYDPVDDDPPNVRVPSRAASYSVGDRGMVTLYKLVTLGDEGMGKDEIAIQFSLNHYVETYVPAMEDCYRKQVTIDGESCILEIVDTTTQGEYSSLQDQSIREGEGFLLVYSITSRTSFKRIAKFYDHIRRVKDTSHPSKPKILAPSYPPSWRVTLVGTHNDRPTERVVSAYEGRELARQLGCDFVEVSTKNCIGVGRAFYDLVRQIRTQRGSSVQERPRLGPPQLSGTRCSTYARSQSLPGISHFWDSVRMRKGWGRI